MEIVSVELELFNCKVYKRLKQCPTFNYYYRHND